MLVDSFGRGITDIRVSVTDRCNFRCVYCHNEGLGPVRRPVAPRDAELPATAIERIVRVAAGLGIVRTKLTGGEPLVREDLEDIVAICARHTQEVSLTTNGSMLAPRVDGLKAAGLRRVNVSIDTVHAETFRAVRGGQLAPVLRGLEAALDARLAPVKVNMVVFQHTAAYIPEMVEFAGSHPGLVLQLIQFMPDLVGQQRWAVDMGAIKAWLDRRADWVEVRAMHHRRVYHLNGTAVEVVDPVGNTEFCMNCHRLRLTPDGKLKGCLNRDDDLVDLRGRDDDGIRAGFRQVVASRVPYYGVYRDPVPLPLAPAPEA